MRIIHVITIATVLGSFGIFALLTSIPLSSSIDDPVNDAVPVRIHETGEDPLVQPYHDIVRADVKRMNSDELLLTVEVNGDPNFNTRYETVYVWVIEYTGITGNQKYTVIVPHFPEELGLSGWHVAIFDNKAERYVVPLKSIGSMPENKVEVNIDPDLIGNPLFFSWQTFVMVRAEPRFDRPPDFLMDSAPDSSNVLVTPFT